MASHVAYVRTFLLDIAGSIHLAFCTFQLFPGLAGSDTSIGYHVPFVVWILTFDLDIVSINQLLKVFDTLSKPTQVLLLLLNLVIVAGLLLTVSIIFILFLILLHLIPLLNIQRLNLLIKGLNLVLNLTVVRRLEWCLCWAMPALRMMQVRKVIAMFVQEIFVYWVTSQRFPSIFYFGFSSWYAHTLLNKISLFNWIKI